MKESKKKILLTGGGTGGHIMPLLLVVEALKDKADLIYVGSSGMESDLVKKTETPFKTIYAGKVRRYITIESILLNIVDLFKNILGFLQSIQIIIKFNPDVIFAKGGYVSLPVILAGALLNKRIYLHESDTVAGWANKLGSKFAEKIFVSFPEKYYDFPKNKMINSGLPVNLSLFEEVKESDYKYFGFTKEKKTILITGGSQGANFLNDLVIANIKELIKEYQIIHLCGKKYLPALEDLKNKLENNSKNYVVYDFFDEMPKALRVSDLVISRASATTMFEIFAASKPAVLIPLKNAASNHQYKNALYAEGAGAAKCLQEDEIKKDSFGKFVVSLMENDDLLKEMASNTKKLARKDSLGVIEKEIIIES